MTNLLKNIAIPNIRIDAVNGNDGDMIINSTNDNIIKNTTMSKPEIGCTLSHIKAISYLKDVEGDYFLICEDDISMTNINLIPKTLKEIINNAPEFDILLMHKIYCRHLNKIYTSWNEEYNKDNDNYAICSTASYIISRSGINKICNEVCNYDSNTNKFNFYKQISVADIFLYNYTNTWVYKYNFISTKDEDSIIHSNHIEYHKKSSKIQLDIINNDFGFYKVEK
jgi:GR25 family glycosyltransferase involved in LPS biosynthesis